MEPVTTELPPSRLIPGKIVAVYATISCLWIFFSDILLDAVVKDPHLMARIAIVKGWAFILVTSSLLFVLIRRYVVSLRGVNETLRESERRFRDLMERVHMIALMLDTRGDIAFCNDHLAALTGWTRDELMGRNWFETFVPPDIKEQIVAMFQKGIAGGDIPFHYENRILTRDGGECLIVWDNTLLRDAKGFVTGIASLGMDVTKHRGMEAQLLHSQKMESIGTLAGGVAHDFNNILTVIINCAEMLRNKLTDRERAILLADQILGSAQRAAKLTRSLLAFSRKQQIIPRLIDLNELVAQTHGFLERIIGEDVELKMALCNDAATVLVDRGQIEQVIMNLASNARDAMPEGGRLNISTAVSRLDGHVFADGSAAVGRYVLLTLTDTGVGIAKQEQERIFEPFFTTKEVGKGTGLGLSMAYGIIRQHNGWITVESELGGGSSFRICLPLAAEMDSTGTVAVDVPRGGTETILLVEDDEQVLQVNKSMLEENGYRVIPARDGEEAVQLFRSERNAVALAIIDVVMPLMSGRQVYDELSKLKPDLPVIFTSGYPSDAIDRTGVPQNAHFIAKPMASREFLNKVRNILDGNP
jgi:two-component system cell cycle sensor histidine kinase/response regulator CckA